LLAWYMFIYYLCSIQLNNKVMPTVKTNIWNLKVGDVVIFTNYAGCVIKSVVARVEEKSWYAPNRQSWGTLADYQKSFPDFRIIRKEN
jgi:hypothetical protein